MTGSINSQCTRGRAVSLLIASLPPTDSEPATTYLLAAARFTIEHSNGQMNNAPTCVRTSVRWQRLAHLMTGCALVAAALFATHAFAQSIGGPSGATADIARDAALGAERLVTNKIDQAARDQAAAMINNLRAKLDTCGATGMLGAQGIEPRNASTSVPVRPTLRWNPALALAASNHAVAMARERFFDHTDPQGRTVGQRVKQTGYRWRVVGENLAAGQESVGDAVRGWLLSTSHCNILIDARFTEFGLARVDALNPTDPYGSYWTLVVARPKGLKPGFKQPR